MPSDLSPLDRAKRAAAERAAAFVESGMRLGLGTGSTAAFLVRRLGERVREEGLKLTCVATSTRTATLARDEGLTVVSLDAAGWLDLTIDGADEVDGDFSLIKGGGGALLQEKIVASASDRMIVIADTAKEVATLGAFPLPVEVIAFGEQTTRRHVERLLASADVAGSETHFRRVGDGLFVTDEGNHILDLHLGRIGDPGALARALNEVPGVVENGLFIGLCDTVVLGDTDGSSRVLTRGRMAPAV